jgi:hypothetical protein
VKIVRDLIGRLTRSRSVLRLEWNSAQVEELRVEELRVEEEHSTAIPNGVIGRNPFRSVSYLSYSSYRR